MKSYSTSVKRMEIEVEVEIEVGDNDGRLRQGSGCIVEIRERINRTRDLKLGYMLSTSYVRTCEVLTRR